MDGRLAGGGKAENEGGAISTCRGAGLMRVCVCVWTRSSLARPSLHVLICENTEMCTCMRQDKVMWAEQLEPKILDFCLLFDSFLDVASPSHPSPILAPVPHPKRDITP